MTPLAAVVFVLAVTALGRADDGTTSAVTVLSGASFADAVSEGVWLLEFYAPWCGHCKRLEPIYEEVATLLQGDVHVGKVDATLPENQALAQSLSVRGYPTLFLADGKRLYDYKGDRSKDDLVAFARGKYKDATSRAFHPRPTWIDKAYVFLERFAHDTLHVLTRLPIAAVLIFVSGIFAGLALTLVCLRPRSAQPQAAVAPVVKAKSQ